MNGTNRVVLGLMIISAICVIFFWGQTRMQWIGNHRQDLRNLLAPNGDVFLKDAEIVTWEPDPNYKPHAYYLLRSLDEATFRSLAKQAGLTVVASPDVTEGIWQLPVGLKFLGWTALDVPPGSGLQTSGSLGGAAVWLRWYKGKMFFVALSSSP